MVPAYLSFQQCESDIVEIANMYHMPCKNKEKELAVWLA